MRPSRFFAVFALFATACAQEFEPPEKGARNEEASLVYRVSLFDTVGWVDDSARATEGNRVYAEKCRRCHGPLGAGGTAYAAERGLAVPSLLVPEWALADMDSVRRKIFVGHEEGMPVFGIAGITSREIDASAFYVLHQLRPDGMGEGGR